ncbi:RagB/SusD family nutrient uptake outer membrane protein [Flagellimonas baculiformis]|uniref:RagB/SusD family nutrient uptake outer membrane protein n=1 Tax=Flagellimonas baculiformis TaxID=3067310 RepID=UPI00296E5DA4|nr:RagB/SusD family nutrient uptake outer membrane protein [Muricauda sp. D6]
MTVKINFKAKVITVLSVAFLLGACTKDIIEENPRGQFTPDFFQSETGVQGGVVFLYETMRDIYGNNGFFNATENGTDHYTWAESATGDFKNVDLSGEGQIISDEGATAGVWFSSFPAINTANGILENAETVGLDPALVAEVRFFRAFYYFLLVQTYGGVPLDLGSGELAFNRSAVRTSTRNTVPEVYTKAIFPDLVTAVNDLPENPRLTGTVTKNVARLMLAKAYLTYGWWLENPEGIPTYPETPRNDPDGNGASFYFQEAYDLAMEGIQNPGPYGLLEYFYDVHDGANDRHQEMMLYADRTPDNEQFNGAPVVGWGTTSNSANTAVWMATSNYTTISVDGVPAVQRQSVQSLGRPWTRMAPTINALTENFPDKDIDSRYDGTFVTSYRGNWDAGGDPTPSLTAANGLEIVPGDAVISFLDEHDPAVVYEENGVPINGANIGGGVLPGRSDYVINLNEINRRFYPGLWKIGTYRTDNEGGLGNPNVPVTRPFPIAKFSEFYFIAAEAAVKGASGTMTARELINVIRARAGKWRFDNGEQEERIEDNSAAMVAATPLTIDIDYILAERSREYFGESVRWYDLVRTQKWAEVAGSFEIVASISATVHSPTATISREIQPYHYLRPIPQGQIDNLDMTDAEKATYQNPGY